MTRLSSEIWFTQNYVSQFNSIITQPPTRHTKWCLTFKQFVRLCLLLEWLIVCFIFYNERKFYLNKIVHCQIPFGNCSTTRQHDHHHLCVWTVNQVYHLITTIKHSLFGSIAPGSFLALMGKSIWKIELFTCVPNKSTTSSKWKGFFAEKNCKFDVWFLFMSWGCWKFCKLVFIEKWGWMILLSKQHIANMPTSLLISYIKA